MAKNLTIINSTYSYPDAGDPKGWGEEASEWAKAVTDLRGDLRGSNDIVQTSFILTISSFIGFLCLLLSRIKGRP